MKIYSFTTFFNENDLFALRMAEEGIHVDKVVVVESNVTYSGWPKSLNFDSERWKNNAKVDYLYVNGSTCFGNHFTPMDRDRAQKNYAQSKYSFEDDDVIIITDCDEVLHEEAIPRIIDLTRKHGFVTFELPCYYFFINAYYADIDGACAIRGDLARKYKLMDFRYRKLRKSGGPTIPNPIGINPVAGNHFSYLSDPKGISEKFKAYAHVEFSGPQYSDPEIIKGRMERLEDPVGRRGRDGKPSLLKIVPVGKTHPKTIRENPDFWKKYMWVKP